MNNAQRLAFATAIMTVVLIGIGVTVRATGSGLGCPDWPTCHGGIVPPGQQQSLIEFSHRFTGMVVGFLVIGTAILAWRTYRHVPFIIWTATAAVPLVGLQGLLGAVTVVKELPPEIVATHLVMAMVVLSCELAVAWAMWLQDPRRMAAGAARTGAGLPALIALGWLTCIMWIGAYMAESGASTACSGWPACNGGLLPGDNSLEITHMVHRYLAAGFIFFIVPFVMRAWRRRGQAPWAGYAAIAAGVLYVTQVAVGAFNVWYTFPDPLTISHTVIASLLWFTLASVVILDYYRPMTRSETTRLSGREVPA